MGMEDRQRVQQHVIPREAPIAGQDLCIGQEVLLGQHGALGAPGGTRGIEQRREIIGPPLGIGEFRLLAAGALDEASATPGVEGLQGSAARPGDGLDRLVPRGIDDHQGRLGIRDEIVELGDGIGRVERQEDHPRPCRREIEDDRLGTLLDLDGQPVARLQAVGGKGIRIAGRVLQQPTIGEGAPIGRFQKNLAGIGDPAEETMEEMGGHAGGELSGQVAVPRRRAGAGVSSSLRTAGAAVKRPSAAKASWFFSIWSRS